MQRRIAFFFLLLPLGIVRAQQEEVVVENIGQRRVTERGRFQARWEMNSAEELAEDWWNWGNAQTSFEDGIARIGGPSYEEWMQRTDHNQSVWWDSIDPNIGFRIETRMRVVEADQCGGVGLWIHDRARLLHVYFCEGQVGIGYPFSSYAEVDTQRFHTYTIEGQGDWVRILVDGQVLLEESGPHTMTGAGTATLMFGNLGGAAGIGEWDWFDYNTRPGFPGSQWENQR